MVENEMTRTPHRQQMQPASQYFAETVAKSFYAELQQAGFGFELIIYVVTQLISELTVDIREHASQRIKESTSNSPLSQAQNMLSDSIVDQLPSLCQVRRTLSSK